MLLHLSIRPSPLLPLPLPQASLFATLDRAVMDVWEALDLLNELREYQAALVAGSAQVRC